MTARPAESEVLEPLPVAVDPADTERLSTADARAFDCRSAFPPARVSATFTRILDLPPDRLDALPAWWRSRARRDHARVARRLTLDPPAPSSGRTWRMHGHLASPWLRRPIAVDVTLWPWLGAWTKMTVEPRHHVLTGRAYFARGHRTLDALSDLLIEELPPA